VLVHQVTHQVTHQVAIFCLGLPVLTIICLCASYVSNQLSAHNLCNTDVSHRANLPPPSNPALSPRTQRRQADHAQRAANLTSPTLRRIPAHPIEPPLPPMVPLLAAPQRVRVVNGRWCSGCKVPQAPEQFGTFQTCALCREASRASRARRQVQAQQQRQAGANQRTIDEMNAEENETVRPILHAPPPPPNPALPTPLPPTNSALPPAHITFLKNFAHAMSNMQREYCPSCHERWFDLRVKNGKCSHCSSRKYPSKYTAANNMDPGPGPPAGLPPLTRIEEMMISPVHCFVQVCYLLFNLNYANTFKGVAGAGWAVCIHWSCVQLCP
jgi:hypothetical protein